jgi:hypothetical protein
MSSRVAHLEAFLELEVVASDTPGVGLLQRISIIEQHIFGDAQPATLTLPLRLDGLENALGLQQHEVKIRVQPVSPAATQSLNAPKQLSFSTPRKFSQLGQSPR